MVQWGGVWSEGTFSFHLAFSDDRSGPWPLPGLFSEKKFTEKERKRKKKKVLLNIIKYYKI
jgi:hypothetical protein